MANCILSGTLLHPDATGALGELVRARIPVLAGATSAGEDGALSNGDWKTFTDSNGAFSLTLPQGATIRLEIPFSGMDIITAVPSASTAGLDDLTGYRTEGYI